MKGRYQKELEKLAKKNKAKHDDILRQSSLSTFETAQHNMQVEAYPRDIIAAYQELQAMEEAELVDNLELERKYGRANKKR